MVLLTTMATHGVPAGVIDLTFLNEEEEVAIRAVLEEDLRLQQAEEARLKYFFITVLYLFTAC